MNQIQLDCFIEAAKNGSITTAAKSMFLSTQVVSQHIQNLEAEIGTTLFSRSKSGVVLTEYGQNFFNAATEWSVLFTQARRDIDEAYQAMAKSLTIGISEYIDYMGEISKPILSFTDTHDNITIQGNHFKSSHLLSSIEEGELDVAIIPDTQIVAAGDFMFKKFAKENLNLLISKKLKKTKGLEVGSKELDELCSSLPQLNTSYGVWTDEEWHEVSSRMSSSQSYKPKTFYNLPNFRSVLLSLKYFPALAVCDLRFGYKFDDSIYHVPLKNESWLCCVWHKQNENRLIREFADHMIRYYGEVD